MLAQLPEPRLPLRTEPWPVGAHHETCPVCSLPWRPFVGSRLPCHARCLFDTVARDHLVEIASSGAYRTQLDLASDLGVSIGILRAVLERGQWSRHTPAPTADPEVPEHALTLHQPWLDAVLEHGKPVENRSWPPPRKLVGKLLALHAGAVYDADAAQWIEGRFGLALRPSESEHGAILGVARVTRAFYVGEDRQQVLAVGEAPDPLASSGWAFGPWCWVLEDLVRVVPVACRGAQRVWLLPRRVRAELAAALDEQR